MSANPPGRTRPSGPRLRPTNPATLIVAALAAAAVGWLVIAHDYGGFPTITWLPTIILAFLGVLEVVVSINLKARIDRKPGTTPLEPLVAVRWVVLAKASSVAGAIFAGFFGAVTLWLFGQPHGPLSAPGRDLPPALSGAGAGLILLVGALLLERSLRVPPRKDEDDEDSE